MLRSFVSALAVLLVGVVSPARAQTVVGPAHPVEPGVVYYYPAPAEPTPVYWVPAHSVAENGASGSPLRRGLQLLADPTRLLPGNANRPGSQYPALDAAPTVVRLVSFGLVVASGSGGGALAGVPQALRLGRVLLVGPPAVATNRRETLLWIASPGGLVLRNRIRDRRAAGAGQGAVVVSPGYRPAACEPAPRRGLFGRRR